MVQALKLAGLTDGQWEERRVLVRSLQQAMHSDMRGAGPKRVCASPTALNPTAW
jgi:hypothetical protein